MWALVLRLSTVTRAISFSRFWVSTSASWPSTCYDPLERLRAIRAIACYGLHVYTFIYYINYNYTALFFHKLAPGASFPAISSLIFFIRFRPRANELLKVSTLHPGTESRSRDDRHDKKPLRLTPKPPHCSLPHDRRSFARSSPC